jgi:FlaG/FlaF family flagellin (archaellin)
MKIIIKKNKFKKKAVTPLITGVVITLIMVIFASIIISFVIPYFNTIEDLTKFRNNKQTLLAIDDILEDLKFSDINSYKEIYIHPNNDIFFSSDNSNVVIEQQITNYEYYSKFKENLDYGNLNISKENNKLIYTLSLLNIDINQTINLNANKQKIRFKVVDFNITKPVVNIERIEQN